MYPSKARVSTAALSSRTSWAMCFTAAVITRPRSGRWCTARYVKPDGKRGAVDYLLYAGGMAIGVVEAKPADRSLGGVEGQARDYAYALDPDVPHHPLPPPTRAAGPTTPARRARPIVGGPRPVAAGGTRQAAWRG